MKPCLIDWVKVLHPTRHKIGHFGDIPQTKLSLLGTEKLNLIQQKHTSPIKRYVLWHKIHAKKLKPCLVASYDIQTGNREGLFWFWCFINLSPTCLLKTLIHLLTALGPTWGHKTMQHKQHINWKQTFTKYITAKHKWQSFNELESINGCIKIRLKDGCQLWISPAQITTGWSLWVRDKVPLYSYHYFAIMPLDFLHSSAIRLSRKFSIKRSINIRKKMLHDK